jgi:hypothetical protein
MKIEMLVTKKYVEVDLKLDTKALSRDGSKRTVIVTESMRIPRNTTCWPYLNFDGFIVKPHISKTLQIFCT